MECIANFRENMSLISKYELQGFWAEQLFNYSRILSSRLKEEVSPQEKKLDDFDQEMCQALDD